MRMANPDAKGHQEAITSRPPLLTGVGRLTTSGRQKTIMQTIPGELFAKFQTSFYSDPVDAVFKALGVE